MLESMEEFRVQFNAAVQIIISKKAANTFHLKNTRYKRLTELSDTREEVNEGLSDAEEV